jgi:hypothetical protein
LLSSGTVLGLNQNQADNQTGAAPMSQRTPYVEIAFTIAVLAFLAYVVAGGFNRPAEDIAQVNIIHSK